MNIKTTLSLCLASSTLALSAHANDGVMGGSGADLVPMKTVEVSMVSEDIQLTFEADAWLIEADYVFRNNAKAPQALQLGFPEYRCEGDEADCQGARSFHFADMKTLVRGVETKHRKGRIKGDHAWAPRLGTVWLFDVTMLPEERVSVRHTYRVPTSYDSMGGRATRYVTRTGALWAGPIAHARFRIRVPVQAVDFIGPEQLQITSSTKLELRGRKLQEVLYEVRDFAPDYDLSFYFLERNGIGAMDAERPDLAPEGPAHSDLADVERCPSFLSFWELGHDHAHEHTGRAEAEANANALLEQGRSSRRICEATVYAKYGKRFEDERLNRYFYGRAGFVVGKWPYGFMRPNPDFDPSWLAPDDHATLEIISRLPERALVAAERAPASPPQAQTPAKAQRPSARQPSGGGCTVVLGQRAESSSGASWVACIALLLLGMRKSRWRTSSRACSANPRRVT